MWIVTGNRLSGTALAQCLRSSLGAQVEVGALEDVIDASVVIVDAADDPARGSPRWVRAATGVTSRVIVLYDSLVATGEWLDACRFAGVSSVHDVREPHEVLVDQVESALAGDNWGGDWMNQRWIGSLEHEQHDLSPRERQVVETYYMAPERTISEVSAELGLSVSTVRAHLANVRRKFAGRFVGNKKALLSALVDRGWMDS